MCSFLDGLAKHKREPDEHTLLCSMSILQIPSVSWRNGILWKENFCPLQAKLPLFCSSFMCTVLHCNGIQTRTALKENFIPVSLGEKNKSVKLHTPCSEMFEFISCFRLELDELWAFPEQLKLWRSENISYLDASFCWGRITRKNPSLLKYLQPSPILLRALQLQT